MNKEIIEIYVVLLEEGTDTIRSTDAENLGNGLAKLLPTPKYDPEDEIWEFLPGSIIRYKQKKDYRGEDILIAYEQVESQ